MQRDSHWISEYQSSSKIFFEIVLMRELNYLKNIEHPFLDKVLRKGSLMFVPCDSTECYIRLFGYTRMLLFINMLHDHWLYTERDNCNYFIRQSWRVAKILCSFKITIMDILQRSSRKGKFNVEEVNLYELQKDYGLINTYIFASTILSSTNFIGENLSSETSKKFT